MPDSLVQHQTDTLKLPARKDGVETTINYNAEDSIRFDVATKTMFLYGKAHIDYGEVSLDADEIQINWETSVLTANGRPDSTGKIVGTPLFKEGAEQYQADKITYNYKTKRGKISGAVTKQGEGYIHAETVKKQADNTIFGRNAMYTTCDLAHPHYFINASKMKVEPGRKVITGPFNLYVGDVPTPVGFLFGMFPTPKERASGFLIPTISRSRFRGFALQNGGYYWAMNDYVGLKFMGDIYSFGGYSAKVNADYYKRYTYRGNFNFSYQYYPDTDGVGESSATVNSFSDPRTGSFYNVFWLHTPEPRPGGGRFSASVNLQSDDANIYSNDIGQRISNTFNSSISYEKTLPTAPLTYTIKLYHTQNNTTRNVTMSLPEFSVATTQLYPLRGFVKSPKGAWYEHVTDQVNFTYRLDGKNQLTNYVKGDTLEFFRQFDQVLKSGQNGLNHNFNIILGNYKLFKYFTFTPNVAYSEAWFSKRLDYRFTDALQIDTVAGFNRVYEYRTSASLNTRVYGMYNFKKGKVKAIRHVLTPEIAYSYKPNYASPSYDFYQWVQTNVNGQVEPRSHYAGFVYPTPSRGEQSMLNMSLGNSLEMKKVSDSDSITGFEKIKLIDNLLASTSYDFARDSFNLNPINLSMYTNLLNRVNVNLSAILSAYQYKNGKVINKYEIERGAFRLARLTQANLDVSTDLNPDNWKRPKRFSQNAYPIVPEPYTTSYPQTGVMPEYIDFDIKWSLFLGFTTYYTPAYLRAPGAKNTTNLNVRGTLNPTKNWRIEYSTSYDMANRDLTATRINVYRDLHCWEMSLGWTPFGYAQGYFVNINVKSAMLRDLKISRNQTFQNRF